MCSECDDLRAQIETFQRFIEKSGVDAQTLERWRASVTSMEGRIVALHILDEKPEGPP